ncbi:MAG TPA: flagellar hook-length control protein FliK [Buttiauxella sp.]|jgi:hypothetical protein
MNIDINALLNGKTALPGRPNFKAEAPAGLFDEAMDEKLAQLTIALPTVGEEGLPVDPNAPLLPVDPALPQTPEEATGDKGKKDEDSAIPGVITLMPMVMEQVPESATSWQLQQVVTQGAGAREAGPIDALRKGKALPQLAEVAVKNTLTAGEKAALTAESQPQMMRAIAAEKAQNMTNGQSVTVALQDAGIAKSADDSLLAQTQIHAQRPVQTMDTVPRPATMQAMPAAIPHPVGTPAWQQSLGQQLSIFTRNGIQNAEIRLHPEELGSLQINMRMQHDLAQLQIISEHPHVRQALEAAIPQLRAALAESGVQLGQTNVSADSSQSAGVNANGQQHAGNQRHGEPGENIHAPEDESHHQILTRPLANGYGINTFA